MNATQCECKAYDSLDDGFKVRKCKLCKAAPALVAALEKLDAYFNGRLDSTINDRDAREWIRAALAAATGGAK